MRMTTTQAANLLKVQGGADVYDYGIPHPKNLAPLSSLLGMSVSALLSLRSVDTEVERERRMMTNRAAVTVRGGGR